MEVLYDKIATLCSQKGISITTMCKDSGISRAAISDLRMGRSKTLSSATLSKIASYFGVSVDYLLGNEEKPAATEDSELDEMLKDEFIAFYGEVKENLDQNDIEDLKTFMRMKAEIKKNREKK